MIRREYMCSRLEAMFLVPLLVFVQQNLTTNVISIRSVINGQFCAQ